jgi:hypothetical protein
MKDEYQHLARDRRRSRRAVGLAKVAVLLSLLTVPWMDAQGHVLLAPLMLPPQALFWISGGVLSADSPAHPMLGLLWTEWVGCLLLAWVAGWQPAESARRITQRARQFFNTPASPN